MTIWHGWRRKSAAAIEVHAISVLPPISSSIRRRPAGSCELVVSSAQRHCALSLGINATTRIPLFCNLSSFTSFPNAFSPKRTVDCHHVHVRKAAEHRGAFLQRVRGQDIVLGALQKELSRGESLRRFRLNHQERQPVSISHSFNFDVGQTSRVDNCVLSRCESLAKGVPATPQPAAAGFATITTRTRTEDRVFAAFTEP